MLYLQQGSRNFGLHNPVGFRMELLQATNTRFIDGEIDVVIFGIRFKAQFLLFKRINLAMFDNFGLATPPLAVSIADSIIATAALNRNITFTVNLLVNFTFFLLQF